MKAIGGFIYAILFIIFILLANYISDNRGNYDSNPHNIKYTVISNNGTLPFYYYALSEIEYLPSGCIKFQQFAYGKINTAVVCGNCSIEPYR